MDDVFRDGVREGPETRPQMVDGGGDSSQEDRPLDGMPPTSEGLLKRGLNCHKSEGSSSMSTSSNLSCQGEGKTV